MTPALPLALLAAFALAQEPDAREQTARERIAGRCQAELDSYFGAGDFPGGSAALVLPDGTELAFTAGVSSKEDERAMVPEDRLLSGSIGKTYVAAAALHLIHAGKVSLDDLAAEYFDDTDWFPRMPNAESVTVHQLLRHQSGIPRYVFAKELWETVLGEPDKVWKPVELLAYVFDADALFDAGEGWAYSDTNYIVVGMILEKVSGKKIYAYVREHFLEPHGLKDTVPSDRREIPGLVQGYSTLFGSVGVPNRVLEDGRFVFNPQFEWCGGGYANTPLDLARWARILWSGEAFEGSYLESMLDGVPARLGPNAQYGIGTILRETEAGRLHGHDGVFPGYQSTMGYFPDLGVAAAFQVNGEGRTALPRPMHLLMESFAKIAAEELAK